MSLLPQTVPIDGLAETLPWLVLALFLAVLACVAALWMLVARSKALAQSLRGLDRLDEIKSALARLLESHGELDLRRLEHVLLDIRDGQRRVEERLLSVVEGTRSSRAQAGALELVPALDSNALADRVVTRLLALGYERVQLVTPPAELAALVAGDGDILVEARRDGAPCKGRILVRSGMLADVQLAFLSPRAARYMSTITTVEKLGDHVGQTVTLRGWLYNKSSKGKLHFAQLRDGTGIVQCVLFKGAVPEELFEAVGKAGQESSLILEGEIKADARAPGGYEMSVVNGRVLQSVDGYPITPKEHGPDFLLNNRHLWLRSKRQWAIMRIRDAVITAIRRFFDERGFVCIDSPIFTPAACEGTSTLFEVDYFDEKAYLTQSGQLYAEATAMALGKVYCFGPTFRAEKSKTRRHLTEFWMLEPEVAYATLEDIMQLAEDMLVYVAQSVLRRRKPELLALDRDLSKLEAIRRFRASATTTRPRSSRNTQSRRSSTATTSARPTRRSFRRPTIAR